MWFVFLRTKNNNAALLLREHAMGDSKQILWHNLQSSHSVSLSLMPQGGRMLCKSEGAQASIQDLGGSGGMLPQENLEFSTLGECF